jgi:predicted DNA binding protein
MNLPTSLWMQPFTVRHPEILLEVLNRMELRAPLTMFETRIRSSAGGDWSEEIRNIPGVTKIEVIDATEGSEVCRVVGRGKTIVPLLKRLRLLDQFPYPVHEGVAVRTVTGPQRRIREFLKDLETESTGLHVESVHHGAPLPRHSHLTPRQQEILSRAMIEGYFDVPRGISLTELAAKVGIAISTLSVSLAVIERKIMELHLS